MKDKDTLKIGILFIIIVSLVLIFLIRVVYIILNKPDTFISTIISHKNSAIRGKIISKDNFIIAKSKKMYSVAVIPKYINPNKKQLLINLLSIYTNKPTNYFRKILTSSKRIVILKNIPNKIKDDLKYLSNLLTIKHVFLANKNTNIIYGLDIFEEHPKRIYPFENRLEPIIGYLRIRNNKRIGMGLEKYYDEILMPKQNGYIKGYRDVKNRIILDNNAIIKPKINGENLKLNINLVLQGKIENMLQQMKKEMNATEVLSVIMETKTGKIISIASSNRYNPSHIKTADLPYLKISHIQYSYEPGSVMKPIILSLLLKNHKVKIFEVFNAYNGTYKLTKHFTIYDDTPFKWLNVIQAIIHSSNIVFAQLGMRLTAQEFRKGLLSFGFYQKSNIDLPYEYRGSLFTEKGFLSKIHRASNAFGYAMQVNLIQLLKAYNTFNNEGIIITPKIAYKYGDTIIEHDKKEIISPTIAQTILNILRKVVTQGTAKATNIKGLFIAGKTGTAKMNQNGHYVDGLYNTSFIGFANDKSHKYTIATLVIKPDKKHYFASQSSVIVFKYIINIMLEMNILKKVY